MHQILIKIRSKSFSILERRSCEPHTRCDLIQNPLQYLNIHFSGENPRVNAQSSIDRPEFREKCRWNHDIWVLLVRKHSPGVILPGFRSQTISRKGSSWLWNCEWYSILCWPSSISASLSRTNELIREERKRLSTKTTNSNPKISWSPPSTDQAYKTISTNFHREKDR